MINHFKIYLKYILKNKLYSFVLVFGFAISLMFVFMLSVYIHQELAIDQFHVNKDRIFRLYREKDSGFAPPVGEAIKTQYPEVENYCRIYTNDVIVSTAARQKFKLKCMLADSSFFSMFSFKLDNPGKANPLAAKNAIVLSHSLAKKLFGGDDPMGQVVNMLDGRSFQVTALMSDFSENTQFEKCDAVLNFTVLADLWGWKELLTTYDNSSFSIYFLSRPGTNLQAKAPQILESFKKDYWLYKNSYAKELKFEPLADVHFSSSGGVGIRQNSKASIRIFSAIVILILIIAVINYINLTIAQGGFRGKETAIKKLMGSSNSRLLFQHITESVALTFFSALIGILLAFLFEPYFNELLNTKLNLSAQFKGSFILFLLAGIPLIGMISGLVPAMVINQFNPIEVVKGTFSRKAKGTYSKILIGLQYCIAIILLICSWGISRQTHFMQTYNTGFQRDNVFWMENTIEVKQKIAFSDVLKTIPGVQEVSYVCGSPIDGGNNQSFTNKGKPISFQEFIVDSAFFNLMSLKIKLTSSAYSKKGYYLNRTALAELELPDTATTFNRYNEECPILGIVDDFNFRSLYEKIGPVMIGQMDPARRPWKIFVKISGIDQLKTVDQIKKAQAKFTDGIPMESSFVDDSINQWYQKEQKIARIVGAFTLLAIIISVMGIFAMSLYYIQHKVKEIGIRKVNGAQISEVMFLLNKDFVKWVVIAFVIATPIANYVMQKWLENFAYKTEMSWWIFVISGLLALGIALLTVSWQSWKAATRNPVKALRYE